MSRERSTVMYFYVYPLSSKVLGWMEYVRRRREEIGYILWCRVVRKTPVSRIDGPCRVVCRQLKPKWHDKSGVTGMVEATATWKEH